MELGILKRAFLGRNRQEGSLSCIISQIKRLSSSVKINNQQCAFLAGMANGLINDIDWSTDLIDMLFIGTIREELLHILRRALQLISYCRDDSWLLSCFMRKNHFRHFVSIVEEFHSCLCIPLQDRIRVVRMCAGLDEVHLLKELQKQLQSSLSSKRRFMMEEVIQRLSSKYCGIPLLPQELIRNSDQGGLLGSGAYGVVFKATFMNVQVAVKQLHRGGFPEIMKEAQVMAELLCPHIHILQLIGYASNKQLVMELMKMDLRNLIEERRKCFRLPFSICTAVDIMCQIAEGMKFLHQNNIIHRDLKPANVLVDFKGKSYLQARSFMVKITDFGTSKCNFNEGNEQTSRRGTMMYMSPEMLMDEQGGNYSLKTDVFSFGIMFSEVLTGGKPFAESMRHEQHLQALLDGVRPPLPDDLPRELRELIEACWDGEAAKRPGFQELCDILWKLKAALVAGQEPTNFQKVMHLGVKISEVESVLVLVELLASDDGQVQEFAMGMLLNLSVQSHFKQKISQAPEGVNNIIGVLNSGTMAARENAAATLYILKEETRNTCDTRGWPLFLTCIQSLSKLAKDGSARGKKYSEALRVYLLGFKLSENSS